MRIEQNVSLKPYNTFGIEVTAARFLHVSHLQVLREALDSFPNEDFLILSGGSNVLFTQAVNRLVLYLDVKGREIVRETDHTVTVRAMCGENWHDLVMWTLSLGLGGLENLALIPGKAGTAPVQNIGAYGIEIKDVIEGLEAVEISTGNLKYFTKEDCCFGYRDSIFKQSQKGKYIIWSVDLCLTKHTHKLHTKYGDIAQELLRAGITEPKPKDIADAVIQIRSQKLPDPKKLGNSGSFFKNPSIHESHFNVLKTSFPQIPGYPQEQGSVKVPAGWLIEALGFKGFRKGDAGVHEKQALVLVNYGQATGNEILELAREIQQAVLSQFQITIEPEVNIL